MSDIVGRNSKDKRGENIQENFVRKILIQITQPFYKTFF